VPGAKISTTEPKLENEDLASVMVEAPTVMAVGARAGLVLAASTLLFPAATYILDEHVHHGKSRRIIYGDMYASCGQLEMILIFKTNGVCERAYPSDSTINSCGS
jgi:hypothetical protein